MIRSMQSSCLSIAHILPGLQEMAPALGYARFLRAFDNGVIQRLVGSAHGLAPALEEHGVAGFQAERRDLHQRVGRLSKITPMTPMGQETR